MVSKKVVFVVLCCLFVCGSTTTPSTADLATQCSDALQKLVSCLNFASGKAPAPPKDCCNSVATIKETTPHCLCFIIAQAHNGSEQLKSMGVQEAKLLQLPSACKLKNASIAECPKLLGIPANSPSAAIFTSNSSTASPATPASSTEQSPPKNTHSSHASQHESSIALLAPIPFFIYAVMAGTAF